MDVFKILNYQFWDVCVCVCVFFWFFVFAQGSFWPSGLGTRKKKRKLFVNINPSSCSHAYNEYWGGKGGGH